MPAPDRRAPAERPRAILFDWDNTLVDNWAAIGDALNATLTAFGHAPWTEAETRERVRRSMRDTFPAMFGDRWEEARDIFYARFTAGHLDTLKALPGAGELLEALESTGIYLGVVSNKHGELLRREAAHLGWTGRFRRLVGAGDAVADKPDAAPVALALEGSGIESRGRVWFVGDAGIDLVCAKNAGCIGVLVGPADLNAVEFQGLVPDWHVQGLAHFHAHAGAWR
ncbi:MAG: HAD hydrolase-like protein [Alphaproteobacteria bacterium]